MFLKQCGTKSEETQEPSEDSSPLAAGSAPLCSLLQCGAVCSLNHLPSARVLSLYATVSLVANAVLVTNQEMFHKLLRTVSPVSTLDLLNADGIKWSHLSQRAASISPCMQPDLGPCVEGHTPGG